MKPLYLSRHTRQRMKLYDISLEEIELALTLPDLIEPTRKNRLNATKVIAGRVIRVTYAEEVARIVVVTVTHRRRLPANLNGDER